MQRTTLSLPIAGTEPVLPTWEGFTATGALAAPEPDAPQGEYDPNGSPRVQLHVASSTKRPAELLSPAGGPDAAFAAFQYGADAIYLGLKKFSARAEAENFTLDELAEVVAYAHSLTPRRRVFVTVNTLIRNDELPELVETLAALDEIGIDALIIQDLGVYWLARQHFPKLELHASTQLSVHNRAGAEALKQLGFQRVVLARELTFEEVNDITASAGIETEVFIHGALCYSYSGLCLFSSQTLGRSGNRGKCAYSCRDSFEVHGAPETLRDGRPTRRDPASGFPFSMKDLALPDHMPALRSAGVSCFKIEGRKKSPLYVATTTDFYRKLLDGKLDDESRQAHEQELQTVFSRPWTHLFIESHRDKEVADRDTVGHRGTAVGHVEAITRDRGSHRLRFRTARNLERHDGLQVDLPVLGKPFGFPIDELWMLNKNRAERVIMAPAGSLIEVGLPADHPELPIGAAVYCSSSQEVKRKYRHNRPKPGAYCIRRTMDVVVRLDEQKAVATGTCRDSEVSATAEIAGPFAPAKEPDQVAQAAASACAKLGNTALSLGSFILENRANRFVPVSRWNQLRRQLVEAVEAELEKAQRRRIDAVLASVRETPAKYDRGGFRWNIKVDRVEYLDAFQPEDWAGVDEIVIDISRDHPALLDEKIHQLADALGRDRIRLALPALTRKWEERGLRHKIERFQKAGWSKWEAANVSAWSFLGVPLQGTHTLDLAADWSLYSLNRLAARQLQSMGVTRFCLSPEDGLENIKPMLAEFGSSAILIVYQDTPLFLAESCAYANLIGGCPGKGNCRFENMVMTSSHGEKVLAIDYHCRTIVLNQGPFCLAPRLRELAKAGATSLRCDFVYRPYEPSQVRDAWRRVRAGKSVPGGHAANFDRGVL